MSAATERIPKYLLECSILDDFLQHKHVRLSACGGTAENYVVNIEAATLESIDRLKIADGDVK